MHLQSIDLRQALGHAIKEARKQAGHSQQALAVMLGVNTSTIWRWEKGRRPIAIDDIAALADACETSYDHLLEMVVDILRGEAEATLPDATGEA